MKKIVIFIVFLLTTVALTAANKTLSPKGGGKDDRGAIMNALKSKPDTLFLTAGEFTLKSGPILINSFMPEKIVIVGAGMDKTVIQGTSEGCVVISNGASAHNVTLSGLTLTGGSRTGSSADKGGGVFADCKGGKLLMQSVKVTGCNSTGVGAGVAIVGMSAEIDACVISDNSVETGNAYAGYGGGIYYCASNAYADATPAASLTITDSHITGNKSSNGGGGVCVHGNSKFGDAMKVHLDIKGSVVANNESGKNGGGIYLVSYTGQEGGEGNVSASVERCIIIHNEAANKSAVGLACGATGSKPLLDMTGTLLTLNMTSESSTGVFDTDLSLARLGKFSDNKIGKAKGLSPNSAYENIELNYFTAPAHPGTVQQIKSVAKSEPKKDLQAVKKPDALSAYNYGGLLAQVLQSNMVVQQGKPFTFWGNAPVGETVTVEAGWAKPVSAQADKDGVWKAQVPVPAVKPGDYTPYAVTIRSTNDEVRLDNILIGEVWFMSGQSNMTMRMKPFAPWHDGVVDYENEIKKANHPNLRLYRNEKCSSEIPQNISSGTWELCTPGVADEFSAVGYYFGEMVMRETGYAVGVILSGLGGMSCQSFTPAETLQADPELREKLWEPFLADPEMGATKRPSHLYNGMIHPFLNLSIRGFGWYQGESNAGHRELYTKLCAAMIKEWRKRFAQGDLPFYYVQVTPKDWSGKGDFYAGGYAYFREAQANIAKIVNNCDFISSMDLAIPPVTHPSQKKEVGQRLACLAMHYDYGKKGVYKGPVYESMEISGNKVKVNFVKETVGSGLNTRDGGGPKHFYLCGPDQIFYKAEALIKGDAVELSSPEVSKPVAVRYAFLTFPVTNFQNKEGFAAYPFRTDNFTKAKYYEGK